MSAPRDARPRRLERAALRASRRLRYRTALARLAVWLPLPLAYAAGALAAVKVLRLDSDQQLGLSYVGVALVLVAVAAVLQGLLRSPPRWAGALALDQHHRLDDRVTTALELLEVPAGERSDFAAAAIDDGLGVASKLDPRRAVPVAVPRELGVSALLVVLLAGVGWFEIQVVHPIPPAPSFEALVLSPDDLELFSEIGRNLAQKAEDPDSLAAIRRFNALVEDIADRRLDRKEAFERLGELEAELARRADADQEARELGLSGIADELKRSSLTKPAAEALEQKRLADAEKALRDLAERLKRKDQKLGKAELDKLRSALERASKTNAERLQSIERRRQELEDEKRSLLKKRGSKDEKAAERDPKAQENRRKLERLDREKGRADRAAKELSDLDRELAEAAAALKKDQAQGAEDIQQSAENLNRMAKKEMSDQEKRELLQRLREMRELMRQQGQGGAERMRQMTRFGRRARGGQAGEGHGEQKGGRGKGQGQQGVQVVEVPTLAQGQGPGQGQSGGSERSGEGQGADQPGSGKQWGKGTSGDRLGDPTAPKGQTQDVSAAAVDTGEGAASAEVIHGAAERGFVSKSYRDVFVQYESVAEQSLEHDQIPPGYRFYVRRYFQLIRPRE